jgi:hypothetical protein
MRPRRLVGRALVLLVYLLVLALTLAALFAEVAFHPSLCESGIPRVIPPRVRATRHNPQPE